MQSSNMYLFISNFSYLFIQLHQQLCSKLFQKSEVWFVFHNLHKLSFYCPSVTVNIIYSGVHTAWMCEMIHWKFRGNIYNKQQKITRE